MNVFTFKLKQDKIFVGGAPVNTEEDAIKYFHVYSNNWIKKYPIVELLSMTPIKLGDNEQVNALNYHYEIDRITSLAMLEHSIENVRGGSMIEPKMLSAQVTSQRQFLKDCREICYKCYSIEHEVSKCNYLQRMTEGSPLEIEWDTTEKKSERIEYHRVTDTIITPFHILDDSSLFSSAHMGDDSEHSTSNMFSSSFCASSYR